VPLLIPLQQQVSHALSQLQPIVASSLFWRLQVPMQIYFVLPALQLIY